MSGGEGEMEEEEDVIWDGSPLHQHLLEQGMDTETETSKSSSSCGNFSSGSGNSSSCSTPYPGAMTAPVRAPERSLNAFGASGVVWPEDSNHIIEIELAQKLLETDLLVQEDEDFINNFILTDDAIEDYSNRSTGTGSILSDFLLFSGSVAAVAGTVFFLSERAQLAATAASVLPSALAAVTSLRMSAKVKSQNQSEQFKKLVDQLLSDMTKFKIIIRKSLNLLQGMELMSSGYMFAVNTQTGAPSTVEESKLSKALSDRSAFPALRHAVYKCTVQLIKTYREAVETLFTVSPLSDHVDFKEHYIAFIELEQFGINEEIQEGDDIAIKTMKDVVQVALVQQSEYLRRFALTFSEKVRDDNKLDKVGVINHVKELISTIKKINNKLSQVFEYHQALGTISEEKQKALMMKKRHFANFVPLRSVYTSLFSTGLHLQNSLLKVRHLEKAFDLLEKVKQKSGKDSTEMAPSEKQLLEWLKGFQEIQTELTACVNCLEEGVGNIDVLKNDGEPSDKEDGEKDENKTEAAPASKSDNEEKPIKIIEENKPVDEVFEAVIEAHDEARSHNRFEDDFVMTAERKKEDFQKRQSEKVLQELRHALATKARERELREARALARQRGEPFLESVQEENDLEVENDKLNENGCDDSSIANEISKGDNTTKDDINPNLVRATGDTTSSSSNGIKVPNGTKDGFRLQNGTNNGFSVPNEHQNGHAKNYNCFEDNFDINLVNNSDNSSLFNGSKPIVESLLDTTPAEDLHSELSSTIPKSNNSSLSDHDSPEGNSVGFNSSTYKSFNDLNNSSSDGDSPDRDAFNSVDEIILRKEDIIATNENFPAAKNPSNDDFKTDFDNAAIFDYAAEKNVLAKETKENGIEPEKVKPLAIIPENISDPIIRTTAKDIIEGRNGTNSDSSSETESESSESDRETVKSLENNKTQNGDEIRQSNIPRSISGQLLEEDSSDEYSDSESSYGLSEMNGGSKKQKSGKLKSTPSILSLPNQSTTQVSEEDKNGSISDLRSVSQPDLKRLLVCETTSPYVSLEDLLKDSNTDGSTPDVSENNKPPKQSKPTSEVMHKTNLSKTKKQDSDDWGSADELDHHVLKTYKRPLRPAAASTSSGASVKKRDVNFKRKQKSVANDDENSSAYSSSDYDEEDDDDDDDDDTDDDFDEEGNNVLIQSNYVKRNHNASNPLSMPRHPLGFEASIAAQAAARATAFALGSGVGGDQKNNIKSRLGQEEVFGSDSD